jgi:glyoxylase I family protein
MTAALTLGPVHHIALTVADLDRSIQFYTTVLGFQLIAEFGPKRILSNGALMLGLGPAQPATPSDARFDEHRVGLDHLSFGVPSREDLLRAIEVLDHHDVPHGEISDLAPFGISILAFRDPDNIQLELTAPYQA